MRFVISFFIMIWLSPLATAQTAPVQQAEQKSPQQQAMDQLAEAGIREALRAIQQNGSFYPFALIQRGQKTQAVGYSGDRDNPPAAEEWAGALFLQLRKLAEEQPDVDLMALFRLHQISDDDGNSIYGVWAQVDHREVRPWVIFLPLVENERGKHEVGEAIYYATEEPLFQIR